MITNKYRLYENGMLTITILVNLACLNIWLYSICMVQSGYMRNMCY